MQAVGSCAVGRYAIPQRHHRLAKAIIHHDPAGRRAQCPLHEMGWEADVVILHQAASFFQKVESRLVIYKDTSAFEYIQTGTMHYAALVVRHTTVVRSS